MLKASSLYYAILLTAVAAILCGGIILYATTNKQIEIVSSQTKDQYILVDNGITFGVDKINELDFGTKEYTLFSDEPGSKVQIRKEQWGFYTILSSKSIKDEQIQSHVLVGSKQESKLCLYLSDKNSSLNITGLTKLNGDMKIPAKGINRAYVMGKNFIGNKMVNGQISTSKNSLPKNELELTYRTIIGDEIEIDTDNKELFNSFNNSTKVIQLDRFDLNGKSISGNFVLESKDSVFIPFNCVLNNVIIDARTIVFEKGFIGKAQVYASQQIQLNEEVVLEYPSSLILRKTTDHSEKYGINLLENAECRGLIVGIDEKRNFRNVLEMNIDIGAKVVGGAYISGSTQLKGAIHGFLYTNTFHYKSSSANYQNHLIDAEIDRSKLLSNIYLPDMFGTVSSNRVIQFLE